MILYFIFFLKNKSSAQVHMTEKKLFQETLQTDLKFITLMTHGSAVPVHTRVRLIVHMYVHTGHAPGMMYDRTCIICV